MNICQLLFEFITNIKYTDKGPNLHYYNCQWGVKSTKVRRSYLIYRWIHFILLASILCVSLINELIYPTNKWSIMYINWTLVFHIIAAFMSLYFVTDIYIRGDKAAQFYQDNVFFSVYGGLHSCSTSISLSMVLVYVVIIYGAEVFKLDVCFLTHVGTGAVMLLDLSIASHLVKILDILFPVLFLLIYFEFTLVLFLLDGKMRYWQGFPFIFAEIRWSNPPSAIIAFSIYMFFLILMYILVWCISIILRTIGDMVEAFFTFKGIEDKPCESPQPLNLSN